MANANEYLVFEADQVLTNTHLNQLFNYLDQQERWTRNKLIGIGIACGLDIVQQPGMIRVTKGVGVTSQGYLLYSDAVQDYTYYIPYAAVSKPDDLPFDFPTDKLPFYEPFCHDKTVYQLITDKTYDDLEANDKKVAKTLSSATKNFLDDFVVVLFLEMTEKDLKNCDAFDCNNKGDKMLLTIRALLVKKTDLPNYVKPSDKKKQLPISAPEIELKRFNVPFTNLNSATDVINAFARLVDDATLLSVANAYRYCYEKYKPLLNETVNPFTDLFNALRNHRDSILKNYPVFIQYFYDFVDDMIKAYYEFRVKLSDVLTQCCPDENLFPLHLVLGDATVNTLTLQHDAYRQYFIYSPLFARQANEISETAFLFRRMMVLVKEFVTVSSNARTLAIKITPSQYHFAWLSQRAIPYYYTVNESGNELYKFWSYYHASRGNPNFIFGYNANLYNTADVVIHPLLYDIEHFNFFRIEGHIGLNFQTALTNILQQRQNFNLPFDVVAVSAELLTSTATLPECNVLDIDTDYKLILSEFACKVHTPFCYTTKFPFQSSQNVTGTFTAAKDIPSFSTFRAEAVNRIDLAFQAVALQYKKGDFMRRYCTPKEATIGSAYLDALDSKGNFTNPIHQLNQNDQLSQLYYYLFEFIDSVEDIMMLLQSATIATLDATNAAGKFKRLTLNTRFVIFLLAQRLQAGNNGDNTALEIFKNLAIDLLIEEFTQIIYTCLDERLQTLKDEYNRRLLLYQQQRNFLNYFKKHPGLEHKGGVPKGGTFVLVYHSVQQSIQFNNFQDIASVNVANAITVPSATNVTVTQMETSAVINENMLNAIMKFVDDCKDAPEISKKNVIDIISILRPQPQQTFQIANNAVIADFYVPYLCCSDCAPVAYVFPDKEVEVVTFNIEPKEFLFDDAHNFPFTVSPPVTDVSQVDNPGPTPVTLLIENNKLFLQPDMEVEKTFSTTLTYKEQKVTIKIIKPDASLTASITTDATGKSSLQAEALDTGADKYEWTVNEQSGILQNVVKPPAVGLDDVKKKLKNPKELVVELTITYIRNNHTTTDTQNKTLGMSATVDFEPPEFVKGTFYGKRANQQPGAEAFTSNSITARVFEFSDATGGKQFSSAMIDDGSFFNSKHSLQVNNINMEFDMTKLGFTTSEVSFEFIAQGGVENLSVNDSAPFVGKLAKAPKKIGNITVKVTQTTTENNAKGTITLVGDVKKIRVGGQELWIDNVSAKR